LSAGDRSNASTADQEHFSLAAGDTDILVIRNFVSFLISHAEYSESIINEKLNTAPKNRDYDRKSIFVFCNSVCTYLLLSFTVHKTGCEKDDWGPLQILFDPSEFGGN
jgi:hypothetical protein